MVAFTAIPYIRFLLRVPFPQTLEAKLYVRSKRLVRQKNVKNLIYHNGDGGAWTSHAAEGEGQKFDAIWSVRLFERPFVDAVSPLSS